MIARSGGFNSELRQVGCVLASGEAKHRIPDPPRVAQPSDGAADPGGTPQGPSHLARLLHLLLHQLYAPLAGSRSA